MKVIRKIMIVLFIALPLTAMGARDDGNTEVSGFIQGGLRYLEVDNGTAELEYTVYRGDYIVFIFEKDGEYSFKIPELDIDTSMPRPESEKPYVKMKKSGEYGFMLGDRNGKINVLELVDANYSELKAYDANRLIDNVQPLIIDVRTPGEYESGHIPGASLLPVQVFADNLDKLEQYKDEDIFLYCASGNRSTVAAKILIDAGFTKVHNLRSGIAEWMREGLPVEK